MVVVFLAILSYPRFNFLFAFSFCFLFRSNNFNHLVGKRLTFHGFYHPSILIASFSVFVFVGIVAGSYPAFSLSSFQPASIFKNMLSVKKAGFSFRSVLVVFQFAISIILIICVGVVSRQMTYISNRKLGFNKEHVVVVSSRNITQDRLDVIKTRLLRHPRIEHITAAKHIPPGGLFDSESVHVRKTENSAPVTFNLAFVKMTYDYLPALGISLVSGRDFSKAIASDARAAYIINEAAVRQIGFESPDAAIGKSMGITPNRMGKIIGVVKDFHFESLHNKIKPFMMKIHPWEMDWICIRVRPNDIPETLSFIRGEWESFRPDNPFTFHFLDTGFDRLYASEQNLQCVFMTFAILAIFIACLGLLGLASFMAEQRTKEIGIRKVLGGSVSGIAILLSREFTKWVLIANIAAWPVAYYAMNKWLQNYAYRTQLDIWTFILSSALALIVAVVTVSYQSVKAATVNPVDSLKYE